MKTIILSITLLIISLTNNSYATCPNNMNGIIEEIVKFENGELTLEKNQAAFVKVSFKIDEQGNIMVLEINYSDESIKNKLIQKLSSLNLYSLNDCKEVFNYNFTFKKY